jgi:hypothetical protein
MANKKNTNKLVEKVINEYIKKICDNDLLNKTFDDKLKNITILTDNLIDYCIIQYNTKQFTKKRVADLEKLVNVAELQQMPFLPMEMVRFDEMKNIKDIEQHLLVLSLVELPF